MHCIVIYQGVQLRLKSFCLLLKECELVKGESWFFGSFSCRIHKHYLPFFSSRTTILFNFDIIKLYCSATGIGVTHYFTVYLLLGRHSTVGCDSQLLLGLRQEQNNYGLAINKPDWIISTPRIKLHKIVTVRI